MTTPDSNEKRKRDCYCRQYTHWKSDNPFKVVDWSSSYTCDDPQIRLNIQNDNTENNNRRNAISFNDYLVEINKHCKKCIGTESGDYTSKDCVADTSQFTVGTDDQKHAKAIQLETSYKSHNNLARTKVSEYGSSIDPTSLLINIDNNLKKNISLNKTKLINTARSINTKKRMLLYDEETDRLYRMIVFILKFLLLVISIVTIKLIYDS